MERTPTRATEHGCHKAGEVARSEGSSWPTRAQSQFAAKQSGRRLLVAVGRLTLIRGAKVLAHFDARDDATSRQKLRDERTRPAQDGSLSLGP
jgi:hypothetical protein